MRIRITCTDGEYQAGLAYEVPDKQARALIEADKAFEIPNEQEVEVLPKPKGKVRHDSFG
jgi:hypothetical protein